MSKTISFGAVIETVKKFTAANAVFLLLMSVYRLVFFIYYGGLKTSAGLWPYVLKAFFLGVRFDLAVIAYVNLLVTLTLILAVVIGRKGFYKFWLICARYYCVFMFSFVFIILCVDFGFYSFFKNHINIIIFGILEDDTKALFSTLVENYNIPLVSLIFLVMIFGIYSVTAHFTGGIDPEKEYPKVYPFPVRFIFLFGLLVLNALAARGSLALFPLGTMDAEISPDIFINKVSINGIYTLQEAVEARMKENGSYDISRQVGYSGDPARAFSDFLCVPEASLNKDFLQTSVVRKTKKNELVETIRPNVILIMMESFGSDLLHYNSPGFNVLGELKQHFDSDTVFYNFLSGDVGTIGSIETAILNMPKRPAAKAVTQSKFAYNYYFTGAAVPYKKAGYETIFLYGGNAGWRNVFMFAGNLGFDSAEGAGSMNPEYPRNQWGVYDEYLFRHIYDRLSKNDGKPKFIFTMTTTNHPPYSLPKDYKKLPLEISPALQKQITGDMKLAKLRFETYQYSNQKLGELISRIKASPFGKNTIIAVTGDHNFWSVFDYPKERYLDLDGVPFYLYIPEGLKPMDIDKETFGSHLDIMATLYNLSLSGQEYASLGEDMLDKSINHVAFNVDGLVMSKDRALRCFVENNVVSYYAWDPSAPRLLRPAQPDAEHEKLLKHFKSALAVADYLIKNPIKK